MNIVAQFLLRLFSKTPLFFTVIKYVALVTALITGLPSFLEFITNNGIDLPDAWVEISNKVVAWAAIIGAFVAQLTLPTAVKEENKLP